MSKKRRLGGSLIAGSKDICQMELEIIHAKKKMPTEPNKIDLGSFHDMTLPSHEALLSSLWVVTVSGFSQQGGKRGTQ